MRQSFHLGAVLTVTTGRMMAKDISEVYKLLNYMTDNLIFTHQIPRVRNECAPYILNQFPQLLEIDCDHVNRDNFVEVLESLCAEYGEMFEVNPLPYGTHQEIDPTSELVEKVPLDRIITIDLSKKHE